MSYIACLYAPSELAWKDTFCWKFPLRIILLRTLCHSMNLIKQYTSRVYYLTHAYIAVCRF